ncbi:hypothetical protein RLEG3_23025 [Rhizobium leguminosarum bv. trifolii WSM1689]|uniref:hypothetical protein n=1 Tax=Rhizobium leguminosarum TaxID=384 RepID=UPI0003E0B68C|nr:hypothetical protein [Rhizobium leguminosarum]AHF86760.1 hypothetical protein RLEG3_23025 [Rhizobium leguminosarum bv. trifolii WSM1689]
MDIKRRSRNHRPGSRGGQPPDGQFDDGLSQRRRSYADWAKGFNWSVLDKTAG